MSMEPTVHIALDKRYAIKSGPDAGKYHAKIWVTFVRWDGRNKKWDPRGFTTGYFVTEEEFALLMENDPKKRTRIERLKDIRRKLEAEKARAEHIIKTCKVTTEQQFRQYFLSDHKPESLALQFKVKIDELDAKKKYSNKENYETSLKSLQEFFGPDVTFHEITPDRLREYEAWYVSQNRDKKGLKGKKSITSVGINMRNLRHIYRRSIRRHIIPESLYPFGSDNDLYVIPEGESDDTKVFLDTDEKDKFMAYRSNDESDNVLHDYAIFSYYGQGMNFSDIARLTRDNIKQHPDLEHGYISIVRKKVAGRKKKNKPLRVVIHPKMAEIIQRRGNKSLDPHGYVFPILDNTMNEEDIFRRIRKLVSDTNKALARISKALQLSIRPTTYTLRHTFSNQLIDLGASTEELQDALGHASARTTEYYKHGIALAKKKRFSEGL